MTVRQKMIRQKMAGPWLTCVGGLLLAACVAGQPGDSGLDQAVAREQATEPVKLPVAEARAIPKVDDAVEKVAKDPAEEKAIFKPAARSTAVPEPAAKTPPPRPVPDLQQLVGMNRGGLSGLLGRPTLWRSEPPAEVWQYSAAQCVLHIFLYSDAAADRYLVSHVEVIRRRQPAVAAVGSVDKSLQQECLGRVLHRATAQNQASQRMSGLIKPEATR